MDIYESFEDIKKNNTTEEIINNLMIDKNHLDTFYRFINHIFGRIDHTECLKNFIYDHLQFESD